MKSKLSTLLWAIIAVIGIITIMCAINTIICYYVPSLKPYLVIVYIPILVWVMYDVLRDKKRYFLVSYYYSNGMGNTLLEDTCLNIREIEADINNETSKNVLITSITELTKKEYKLSMGYNGNKLQDK